MGEEIKIGNKTYKVEDFYKLKDEEFVNIYEYVIKLESDLINKIRQGKISNEQYIDNLKSIQKIRNQLLDVEIKRVDDKINSALDEGKVEPTNDIDSKFNQTLENVSGVYDKVKGQISNKIDDIQDDKDRILEELLASTPRKELTPEDEALTNSIIKEYENKSRDMNTLDKCSKNISKEQTENISKISNQYVEKAIVPEQPKREGIFSRISKFINNKLMPKRLEKKVYKEKKGKLKNIIDRINAKLLEAKNKAENKTDKLKEKLKSTMALGLVAIGMLGNSPSMISEKDITSNISDSDTNIEYEVDFSNIEDISSFAGIMGNGDIISFDANLDDAKLDAFMQREQIIDEEASALVSKDITKEQVKNIMRKFLEIDSKDATDEEKINLMLKYLSSNEDDLSSSDKIAIMDLYKDKVRNGQELYETENEINTSKETAIKTKEKSDYSKVKGEYTKIEDILRNVPVSDLKRALSNNFEGMLSETDINNLFVEGQEINKDEIEKILKAKVLNNYLEDDITDGREEDYRKLNSIFENNSMPETALKSTLLNNIKYIDENSLTEILSMKGLSKDQIKSLIMQEIDMNYKISQLTGDAQKAYDIVDSIMSSKMPESQKLPTLIENLKGYISEKEINDIYYSEYFSKQQQEVNTEVSNINIQVTPEGDKYFINEQGEKVFISDEIAEQLGSQNVISETTEYKSQDETNKRFESKLKERILNMQERGEDNKLYEDISKKLGISAPDSNRIIKESIMGMSEIKQLINAGIIDSKDVNEIIDSDGQIYEKTDKILELIQNGRNELSVDEETRKVYDFIENGIESNDPRFTDKLRKLVPLDAMEEIGIINNGQIEDILNNTELSAKQKESMIKKLVNDGNKTLEKLGYEKEDKAKDRGEER